MKVIVVTVAAAQCNASLVSRLRDTAEDLYREFMAQTIIEIPDMDSATTQLHIHLHATRHLGDVSAFLKKSLRRHGLAEHAVLTRADRASA
jgi:hypothetical protein